MFDSEFHKKYKEIICESNDIKFSIQDNILLIFNRNDENNDMFGLPGLRNMIDTAKSSFNSMVNALINEHGFNISPIDNDEFEDGIYVQINKNEVTVGVMLALDNLNDEQINQLKDYLLSEGLSQGV